jgi:hypothetical protein
LVAAFAPVDPVHEILNKSPLRTLVTFDGAGGAAVQPPPLVRAVNVAV